MIWAATNPMQLSEVDYTDFGNDGDVDRNDETPFVREIVRTMRDRVWISTFSRFEDGYRFQGDAIYSTQIRNQYENHQEKTGVSIRDVAKRLMNERLQTILGPQKKTTDKKGNAYVSFSTRKGKYWIYDEETRRKSFEIDFREK